MDWNVELDSTLDADKELDRFWKEKKEHERGGYGTYDMMEVGWSSKSTQLNCACRHARFLWRR